jgi:hypothetical protein
MKTATVYHVTIKMPMKGQMTEISLGYTEDWETLKDLLYALLFSLRGTEFDSLIITPLEVEAEQQEQA